LPSVTILTQRPKMRQNNPDEGGKFSGCTRTTHKISFEDKFYFDALNVVPTQLCEIQTLNLGVIKTSNEFDFVPFIHSRHAKIAVEVGEINEQLNFRNSPPFFYKVAPPSYRLFVIFNRPLRVFVVMSQKLRCERRFLRTLRCRLNANMKYVQ
jgi:hypothetical protein